MEWMEFECDSEIEESEEEEEGGSAIGESRGIFITPIL